MLADKAIIAQSNDVASVFFSKAVLTVFQHLVKNSVIKVFARFVEMHQNRIPEPAVNDCQTSFWELQIILS